MACSIINAAHTGVCSAAARQKWHKEKAKWMHSLCHCQLCKRALLETNVCVYRKTSSSALWLLGGNFLQLAPGLKICSSGAMRFPLLGLVHSGSFI